MALTQVLLLITYGTIEGSVLLFLLNDVHHAIKY